jgi:hypothetical protein
MKKLLVGMVLVGMLMGGCIAVTPTDRACIHEHMLNVVAVDTRVQHIKVPTLEEWTSIQIWMGAERKTWVWMNDWASGKAPTEFPSAPIEVK